MQDAVGFTNGAGDWGVWFSMMIHLWPRCGIILTKRARGIQFRGELGIRSDGVGLHP